MKKFHFNLTLDIGQLLTIGTMVLAAYAWALDTRNLIIQERDMRAAAQRATNSEIASVTAAIKDLDWKLFNYITNNIAKPRASLEGVL